MTNLYVVGGASGSGKTAILPTLQKLVGTAMTVYDFDDIGVPENADKRWRQQSTDAWLQKIIQDGHSGCLLGQAAVARFFSLR